MRLGALRRPALIAATIVIVLAIAPGTAAAHGVDIEIDLAPGALELEFTDETGRTCARLTGLDPSDLPATVVLSPFGEDVDLITIDVDGPGEVCQLEPVELVDEILADTDAFRATVVGRGGDVLGEGVLRKPLPPGFERVDIDESPAAGTPVENDGVDGVRVFLIGGALGLIVTVVRRWRR